MSCGNGPFYSEVSRGEDLFMEYKDAFSDESGSGNDRYWSVAFVTGFPAELGELRNKLREICTKNQIGYLEWKEITGDSKRTDAGREYVRATIDAILRKSVHIDVLIWDRQDERHAIKGRDDIANLERMYYKLFVNAGRRWRTSSWRFFPDQQSSIDWSSICSYLEMTRVDRPKPGFASLFADSRKRFNIVELTEQDSKQEPLIQLADVFAGMGRFSAEKKDKLQNFLLELNYAKSPQLTLFEEPRTSPETNLSLAEKARFELITFFDGLCKKHTLGVSLRTKGYLWTPPKRSYPINFWFYKPQHEFDKAPTKS